MNKIKMDMRKLCNEAKLDELKKALSDDDIKSSTEALDVFESNLSESEFCKSIEFFGMEYDYKDHILTVLKDFNIECAIEIIDCYLDMVEESEDNLNNYRPWTIFIASLYDAHTFEHRGADDGTFDYAGSYMYGLFDMMRLWVSGE